MKYLKILVVLLSILVISACDSQTIEDNSFSFSATVQGLSDVKLNQPFDILVTTKNISGKDLKYYGSSTIIGAIIYLKDSEGNIIRPNDKPVTKDYKEVIIKPDQEIKTTWNFEYELIQNPGSYDLYFEFIDSSCIIEDFIIV